MIPVAIQGATNKSRSPRFSSQVSQNIYLSPDPSGVWPWIAYDFYGAKSFVTRAETTTFKDRGLYVFNDELYQVAGTSFYKIDAFGNSTTLSSSLGGDSRCIFADDGTNIYIVTDSKYYKWDGSSLTQVTTNVDSPRSVAYMNGFFAVESGSTGEFRISDSGAGDTFNGLSVGLANSNSDRLMRIIMLDQILYMIGQRSIEPWYYTGAGNLNFNRVEQGLINMGTSATYSVDKDQNFIYMLGSDRHVYAIQGSVIRNISSDSISREIQSFGKVSDAIGFTFRMEGQDFYYLTFPAADKTFLYSSTFDYWVTLSTGMTMAKHFATSYAYCYNKHWVGDDRTGSIHEWDADTYEDVGSPRLRIRVTEPMTSMSLQIPGHRRITVGSIYPEIEVGGGLTTGQGSDPKLMCSISPDGGQTFTNEQFVDLGVSGDFYKKAAYDQFINGYSIVGKFAISDPVRFAMAGAHVEVTDGGY